jgi:hypothetical protein
VKRRYPLEAVANVRKHQTTERARDKVLANAERRRAEGHAERAVLERRQAEGRLRSSLNTERKHVDSGRARAADLVQAERFRDAAEARVRERQAVERAAARNVSLAREKDRRADEALLGAHGAEKAVSEHRSRFHTRARQNVERREEEAVDDSWRARSERRGRRTE